MKSSPPVTVSVVYTSLITLGSRDLRGISGLVGAHSQEGRCSQTLVSWCHVDMYFILELWGLPILDGAWGSENICRASRSKCRWRPRHTEGQSAVGQSRDAHFGPLWAHAVSVSLCLLVFLFHSWRCRYRLPQAEMDLEEDAMGWEQFHSLCYVCSSLSVQKFGM